MKRPNKLPTSNQIRKISALIILIAISLQAKNTSSDQLNTHDPYARDTAHIGIMSRLLYSSHRTDTSIATEMAFLEFMKNINKKGIFSSYSSPARVLQEMANHRLDAILVNPVDYLEIDHHINPDNRYSLTFGNQLEQKIHLIIRSDLNIDRLDQLKDKHLVSPTGNQLGLLFLNLTLLRNDLPVANKFFSKMSSAEDLNSAIINLFFGKADAALVTDVAYNLATELNPQISHKIEILASSIPMIPLVIGINKSVPDEFTQEVSLMVDNLDAYPRTIHLLSLFKANRIVRIDHKQIEPIRAMSNEYKNLLKDNHQTNTH